MVNRKKTKWNNGAVFAIPLKDGSFGIGQIVSLMMPNVVYCTFFDIHINTVPNDVPEINKEDAISCIAVSREQLDYAIWPIIGYVDILCKKGEFQNENYAANGYIGAKTYDAAIAEDFLSSYYSLLPWDDWYDPNYLDALLLSKKKKPKTLKYKRTEQKH